MLFSGIPFLYYFLPVTLAVYGLAPRAAKNGVLLAASLIFYAWGEPVNVFIMAASIAANWGLGLLIVRLRGRPWGRAALAAAVALNVGLLGLFKYADFFLGGLSALLAPFGLKIAPLGLALPLGISFYTFQIMSYVIDLHRGRAECPRSLLDFAAYVTLFPQLIAGPIVRYTTVARALESRRHSLEGFASGARRFAVGLGKKVLLANVMAELCAACREGGENSVLAAWLYVVGLAFQIYFDFSGYSDMAIGLGRIFGFEFLENFNYPYLAESITDFWRRWHISLGSWFRDYVYIPLGGSRHGPGRQALSLLVVWGLTGLWHGAGVAFILWGLWFGGLLVGEKFLWGAALGRMPRPARHGLSLLLVLVGWVIFDAAGLPEAMAQLGRMVGLFGASPAGALSWYHLRSFAVPLAVCAVGSTPLPAALARRLSGRPLAALAGPLAVAAGLIVSTAYLVDGSFNPFIYFRF